MFTLELDEFIVEIKEGSLKNVGAPNKSATAKLYDVTDAEVREFGDERVKLSFADDEGNEVELALDPDEAIDVLEGIDELRDGRVFEED